MAYVSFDRSNGHWYIFWRAGTTEDGKPLRRKEHICKHPGIKLPYPKDRSKPKPPDAVRQALTKFDQLEQDAAARRDVVTVAPLELEPFLRARIESVKLTGAGTTAKGAEIATESFLAFAKARDVRRVDRVTPDLCREWMEQLARGGMKWSSVGEYRIRVSAAWRQAVEMGRLTANPWSKAKLPGKIRRERPPFWTEDQVAKLLTHCKPWLRDIIVVMVNSGLRVNAALSLRWRDIDWVRDVIHVRAELSKNGYAYDAPLLDAARDVLQPKEHGDPDALVFPGPISGKKIRHRTIFFAVKAAVAKAGIPDLGHYLHIFRHSFATWSVAEGVPLKVVSTWLGHRSIRTTEIYAHVETSETKRWADVVNNRAKGRQRTEGEQATGQS